MRQPIPTFTSPDSISVSFDIKDDVQKDSFLATNANPTSFDAPGGFQGPSSRTFISALSTYLVIEEAAQMESGFQDPIMSFFDFIPVTTMAPGGVPGVKCPTCEQLGVESWVIRGKVCSKCGTPCQ